MMDRILSGNKITSRFYEGCYAADRIPRCEKFPASMVVNLDTASEDGSHWVALFAKSPSHVYYFDSYGMPPDGLLEKYMKTNFKIITQSKKTYQSPFSSVCGHYCIYFLYSMSLDLNFDSTIKLLNILCNPDVFVKDFVSQLICL